MFRLKSSWDSEFSNKIGTFSPNSGRLDTLLGFFGGVRGHAPPEKFRNLRSGNAHLPCLRVCKEKYWCRCRMIGSGNDTKRDTSSGVGRSA